MSPPVAAAGRDAPGRGDLVAAVLVRNTNSAARSPFRCLSSVHDVFCGLRRGKKASSVTSECAHSSKFPVGEIGDRQKIRKVVACVGFPRFLSHPMHPELPI